MNRTITAGVLALGLTLAGAASADAASPKNLKCFADGYATCTITSNGAHLTNTSGPSGDGYSGAGVYLQGKKLAGRTIGSVDFSFSWVGTPAGGAPRFSIPIDEDGNGTTEGYAFLDWSSCGNAANGGTVSTSSASCVVYYGNESFPNWDAFAAAHPTYEISRNVPFIIVDVTSDVYVFDVQFG